MRSQRREVVLLGAWFLMTPPVPSGQGPPDVRAPLPTWSRVGSFETAMRCEQSRLQVGATDLSDRSRCFHIDRLRAMGMYLAAARKTNECRADPSDYDGLIREAADRNDLEYALVKAVIRAESDFDRLAVSPKGASGLMQLMPVTAAEHTVRNVFLARENIEAGCEHLRELLDRYGSDVERALAAYNAGARRVDEWGGVPPIPETRQYLERVLRYRLAYQREGTHSTARARLRAGAS
jgi:soluble lytic murein transglycosylase-like protein